MAARSSGSRFFFILFIASAALAAASTFADEGQHLSLQSYLSQVREDHQGLKASKKISQGSLEHSKEGRLAFAPTLFSTIRLSTDSKNPLLFSYNKLIVNTYTLGVSQQTDFGLKATLSYSLNYFNYLGLPPAFSQGLNPTFHEGQPTLELTQSLWRNSGSSEARATSDAQEASALATHYTESFKIQQIVADAEFAYWRLALARQNILLQKETLGRAQQLYGWTAKRARLQLTDEADALQAQAAVDLRKLQVEQAENDQRAAARAFNLARGRPVGDVAETLESLEVATIESLSPPERAQMREDIKAAEQGQKAAVANGILAQQRDTPTLELFGSLSTFGRAYDLGPTLVDSFHTDRPTAAIGLRFSTPLNFNLKDQSIEGWKKEQAGAEMSYQRKVFEQDQQWLDLLERFKESKKKFALTRAMEQGQSKKLFYEKGRLNRGRTTTFQVLLFEQDYAQAQLALIQSELEIIQIMSQMRLYGGSA